MNKTKNNIFWRSLISVLIPLFILIVILLQNAWVVDDAYITFRTVDNFVNGRGLVWNPGERVQVYTHPLWMFVISFFYFFTSELFFTSIFLSLGVTLFSLFIVGRYATNNFTKDHWKIILLTVAFIASKSVVDYASSGLENSLSYLLAAAFMVELFSINRVEIDGFCRKASYLTFLAALAFVNRIDTIIFYIPALLYILWDSRKMPQRGRVFIRMVLAATPALLWVLFSLFYYGTPFPNTAYAKEFSTGFAVFLKLQRGWDYLWNNMTWDTGNYLILLLTVWLVLRSKSPYILTLTLGVLLYIGYAVFSAASATHMAGRFFAVPFFLIIAMFVSLISTPRIALISGTILIFYILLSPVSAIKFGTPYYQPYKQHPGLIDTKWFVAEEGAAFINWRPGIQMPDHRWYKEGEIFRAGQESVRVGGAGDEAIGYFGFAAGPDKYIIDKLGLGDPLLSRLPALPLKSFEQWKPGHYYRQLPDGYVASILAGRNKIEDPDLYKYYDAVLLITRGPLFSLERVQAIIDMNLGRYDVYIDNYLARNTP